MAFWCVLFYVIKSLVQLIRINFSIISTGDLCILHNKWIYFLNNNNNNNNQPFVSARLRGRALLDPLVQVTRIDACTACGNLFCHTPLFEYDAELLYPGNLFISQVINGFEILRQNWVAFVWLILISIRYV